MPSFFRVFRAFSKPGKEERIRVMREVPASNPSGIKPWLAAVSLWEDGEIEDAHRIAESILLNEPDDFRMLVICLDWSIRSNDAVRTYEFARRVLAADNPSSTIRSIDKFGRVLLWPLRLFGIRRHHNLNGDEADAFDKWVEYAQWYVGDYESKEPANGIS